MSQPTAYDAMWVKIKEKQLHCDVTSVCDINQSELYIQSRIEHRGWDSKEKRSY